ncbi:hypothetical protein [Paracoccus haeundaensis]|uniref:Uncharacterized protein n=1 Tax=Paracoccus haeundaensis TaxID=225362 RepID=A0A5C4R2C9_9RHOB|nr:hypothetical protein [Paracoccus haeundaensis]TNH38086.1 hypothetical protein FHD67_16725 [Paracoccus haeundaensis]
MNTNTDRMLIAETDEQGSVVCVWRADHGKRPRPVADPVTCVKMLDSFGIFGASRDAVRLWLMSSDAEVA